MVSSRRKTQGYRSYGRTISNTCELRSWVWERFPDEAPKQESTNFNEESYTRMRIKISEQERDQARTYAQNVRVRKERRSEAQQRTDHELGKIAEFGVASYFRDVLNRDVGTPDCSMHEVKSHGNDLSGIHIKSSKGGSAFQDAWLVDKSAVSKWKSDELVVLVRTYNTAEVEIAWVLTTEEVKKGFAEPRLESLRQTKHGIYSDLLHENGAVQVKS